ncbi:hypothetical protein AC578_9063 [Pseudocercospora eumusae]|uniref:Uncharacterized protein n=1 Tax=Pseudocercospora eumusae TaxID=321146 RepID=A0A139H8M1_9PEZI|nr:hypothetical protein AC578_9063 [Pseudocercospora eumusae]
MVFRLTARDLAGLAWTAPHLFKTTLQRGCNFPRPESTKSHISAQKNPIQWIGITRLPSIHMEKEHTAVSFGDASNKDEKGARLVMNDSVKRYQGPVITLSAV